MFSSFVLEGADSTAFNRLLLACLITLGMGMPAPVHAQQQAQITFWGGYVVPPYLVTSVPRYPLLPYGYMSPSPYAYPYYSPTQPYPYPYYLSYPPPNTPHFDVSKVIPAGQLFIKIQPEDAEVMVDGFQLKPLVDNTYEIGLLIGPHKVEARKQNYGNYSGVVEVRKNEGLLVTISLQKLK